MTGRLRSADGFTMVEVVAAMLVLAVGLLATAAVYDGSRGLTVTAERTTTLTHRAEAELERVRALGYGAIALTGAPAPASMPAGMASTLSGAPALRPDRRRPTVTERLVIDAAHGAVDPAPRPWSDGRLRGTLQTYVSWRPDPACGAVCPPDAGGKRITAVLTLDDAVAGRPRAPLVVSTVATDPNAAPAGAVADGTRNPLRAPETACVGPDGTDGPCSRPLDGGDATSWFLYDTPATGDTWKPTTGDHPTHPTVLRSSVCAVLSLVATCPVPDLMGPDPTPAPLDGLLAPLLNRSTDVPGAEGSGGRVLRRDVGCDRQPSADNTRSQFWVTPEQPAATTLTGDGGLTLYSRTTSGVAADVTLCVRFFVVGSLLGLVDSPPRALATIAYRLAAWPGVTTPVSFAFALPGTGLSVAAGQRLGVRVWVAASAESDVVLAYDHPDLQSSLQLTVR